MRQGSEIISASCISSSNSLDEYSSKPYSGVSQIPLSLVELCFAVGWIKINHFKFHSEPFF
jgi:hypothetical protein